MKRERGKESRQEQIKVIRDTQGLYNIKEFQSDLRVYETQVMIKNKERINKEKQNVGKNLSRNLIQ